MQNRKSEGCRPGGRRVADDARLARQRAAIELRLKRAEQALALRQLALAEAELEQKRRSVGGPAFLFTPTGVVLIAAALGLLGTALGKLGDYLNARTQQQTLIILKASEVPTSLSAEQQDIQRAKNLLWFADAGYISIPDELDEKLHTSAGVSQGQSVSLPVIQTGGDTQTPADVVQAWVKVPLTDPQRQALISFVSDVGTGSFRSSTLLRKLNSGDYDSVPQELAKWAKVDGQESPALAQRRATEAELWKRR